MQALDKHLHGAVGQLQQLQHGRDGAGGENIARRRIVVLRILLSDDEDVLVVAHDLFERFDGFLAAHKERHDHSGEHHDVSERQHRVDAVAIEFGAVGGDVRHVLSFPGHVEGRRSYVPKQQPGRRRKQPPA